MTFERFLVVADNHGDEQDDDAVDAMLGFSKYWKPKHRIHLGDNWDFRWLRSKASEDDALDPKLQADFDAGVTFLERFRPTVFLMGNHDHRIRKAMDSPKATKRKLAEMIWADMEDALHGVKPIPYNKRDGVYPFGDTKLVHGYSAGIGAVRKHALVYGKVWMGHLHTIESVRVERHDYAEGCCIGCMGRLELGYNEAQIGTLRQEKGFRYGLISNTGATIAWQARSIDNKWIFPSEMKEVKCA
jgi:hypothetical protein